MERIAWGRSCNNVKQNRKHTPSCPRHARRRRAPLTDDRGEDPKLQAQRRTGDTDGQRTAGTPRAPSSRRLSRSSWLPGKPIRERAWHDLPKRSLIPPRRSTMLPVSTVHSRLPHRTTHPAVSPEKRAISGLDLRDSYALGSRPGSGTLGRLPAQSTRISGLQGKAGKAPRGAPPPPKGSNFRSRTQRHTHRPRHPLPGPPLFPFGERSGGAGRNFLEQRQVKND